MGACVKVDTNKKNLKISLGQPFTAAIFLDISSIQYRPHVVTNYVSCYWSIGKPTLNALARMDRNL